MKLSTLLAAIALGLVQIRAPAREGTAEDKPWPPAQADAADWEARDLSGRWLLISEQGPTLEPTFETFDLDARARWIDFLEVRGELLLLEWLCVSAMDDGSATWLEAAEALRRLDAPQWARTVHLGLEQRSRRGVSAARAALADRPGYVLDWFERYPQARETGRAARIDSELRLLTTAREDSSAALAPWPAGSTSLDPLIATIESELESNQVRSAAFLALSYRAIDQPRAWALLHTVARSPGHPAWETSLTRLADLGDGFSLEWLEGVTPQSLDQMAVLDREKVRLRRRLAARDEVQESAGLRVMLERTAWVDLSCHPLESPRGRWMHAWLARRAAREPVHSELERILADYAGDPSLDTKNEINTSLRASLAGRVRAYVRAALE
jgi:hypothetical protein